ncbi:MerR family DNA-binding protein [Sphingopyxis sp. SE2]|nr:MerR family DNA-binding protein [Sphingopyxis sp. SE2]
MTCASVAQSLSKRPLRARQLGFSLDEIRELLRLAEERDRPCAEASSVAAAHLQDVRAKIADLKRMEGVLKNVVVQCGDGTQPECPLIETLFREPTARSAKPRTKAARSPRGHS